jgi:hypothetical protein
VILSGVGELEFFDPSTFAEVGTQVDFPQDPVYMSAGANGRYYVCFAKATSIAIVSGPAAQGTR